MWVLGQSSFLNSSSFFKNMEKYIFILSKDMPDLAKEEIFSLIGTNKDAAMNNILIIEIKNKEIISKLSKRLAYTKKIYLLLFESSYRDFLKNMKSFDWSNIYKKDFSLRISNFNKTKQYSEKELASFVWKKVKKPKVNLRNAKTQIEVFFLKNKILCCLLLKKLKHTFEERKSHLRPRPSPISLHPKLARAMVNLTGAKRGEVILDPFCGSGGILIEAGLMGMKTIGYDINKKMVWKSMVNLKHYKIKDCSLGIKDFFGINKKFNYIVSDLPYGLNTNIMQNIRVTKYNRKEINNYLEKFYSDTITKLEKILIKRAVIIFPSYIDYKKIIKNSKLKLKKEFESYVHKNLTRKIVVLEKASLFRYPKNSPKSEFL